MMLKTIRAKIILIITLMLAVLMLAFVSFSYMFRMKTKLLMLQNYSYSINSFVQNLDNKIIRLEDNSRDLALVGGVFYKSDRRLPVIHNVISKIFESYSNSLGGGIWFEPYIMDKNTKRFCIYMYRNKNNEIVLDESFNSDKYDYHNQGWYKQITSQITKEHNTAWSLPYYENQGSETMMITVGTGIYDGDRLVGISTVDWELSSLFKDISEMKPIEKGFALFEKKKEIKGSFALLANKEHDFLIVSNDPYIDTTSLVGKSLKNLPWYNDNLKKITYFDYHNKKYTPFVKYTTNGMMLIICIPKSEMYKDINKLCIDMFAILLLLGIGIPLLLYFALNRYIMNPIDKLSCIAQKIGQGEDIEIKLEKPEEFARLASTFDKMTRDIKSITKEQEKINSELSIAKSIQESSLPNVFPPFPDNSEFDIFASMEPAREVGGDFYDFYFINDNTFMFLIADVSGKGVPAALFMMTVKTLVNNLAQNDSSPENLFKTINKKICKTNEQGFFVTMLAGIVNTETGKLSLINCGHNQPLLKRNNGKYEYLNLDSNIVLGAFEDADFKIYETELNEGDIIFTYTDGITEAINQNNELFGEEKLLTCLNNVNDNDVRDIANSVHKEIKTYTESTPQSDDITMLIFKYQNRLKGVKIFKQKAEKENYKPFYNWIHNVCEEWNLTNAITNKIDMCAEEIFANITFYAYPEGVGDLTAFFSKTSNEIILTFEDSGIAYNPLEKPNPDITLPPEKRPLGGLGIFMVKEMAKDVEYERIDGKNILKITFEYNSHLN